jgi:hypothetical protein
VTPLALTKSDLLVTTALKTVRKYVHVVWNRRTDVPLLDFSANATAQTAALTSTYSAYPTGPATITLEPLQVPSAEQPSPIDPVSGRRFLVHTEPLAQNIPITVSNSYRGAWERIGVGVPHVPRLSYLPVGGTDFVHVRNQSSYPHDERPTPTTLLAMASLPSPSKLAGQRRTVRRTWEFH